jgi:hypothetical protein
VSPEEALAEAGITGKLGANLSAAEHHAAGPPSPTGQTLRQLADNARVVRARAVSLTVLSLS